MLAASRYLEGAIGRLISLRSEMDQTEERTTYIRISSREMWNSARLFDQAFSAARRYYDWLPENTAKTIKRKLGDLGDIHGVLTDAKLALASKTKRQITDLLEPINKL